MHVKSTPPIISHMVGQVTFVFRERIPNNYCSSHCQTLTLSSISIEMLLPPKTCIFAVKKNEIYSYKESRKVECVSKLPGFSGRFFCYVYQCIHPSVCFMKQRSSFHANWLCFFLTLSHRIEYTVQCVLKVMANSVCLFTTWCLLMLFDLWPPGLVNL